MFSNGLKLTENGGERMSRDTIYIMSGLLTRTLNDGTIRFVTSGTYAHFLIQTPHILMMMLHASRPHEEERAELFCCPSEFLELASRLLLSNVQTYMDQRVPAMIHGIRPRYRRSSSYVSEEDDSGRAKRSEQKVQAEIRSAT